MPTDPIQLINKILEPTTTAAAPKKTEAAATAAQSAKDYVLSQSLNARLSGTGGGTRTQELATYSAKGLAESFKKAHEEQMADKKTPANPMDSVLADAKQTGTNAPQLSAQAQASIKNGTQAAADAGLNAIDKRLAQVVGISRAIGSA